MKTYLHYLRPFLPLVIASVALWLLFRELGQYHYHDVVHSLKAIPATHILLAVGLTVANYTILVGYDWAAVRYLRYSLSLGRIALASFVSYVSSYNFGVLLGGTSVRYRMYSAWGLPGVDVVKLVAIVGLTFWMGFVALAGAVFVVVPLDIPARLHMPFGNTRLVGLTMLLLLAAYLIACMCRKSPMRLGGWSLPLPPIGLSLTQIAIASADLMVATGVLYVLLPDRAAVDFPRFLSIYLLAVLATVVTSVPGGLGVFELTVIVLLPAGDPKHVLGALLVYRVVYYLLPLLVAAALLGGSELMRHGRALARVGAIINQVAPALIPRLFSFGAFAAGAVLLLTGSLPISSQRLHWTRHWLPLTVLETSHLLGSIAGVALLVVARGLSRRLDSAYWAAVAMLCLGMIAAVLRGFDFEEASVLLIVLMALVPCRRHFYRRGSLLRQPFGIGWLVGAGLVLLCSVWIGLFAYKHVEFSQDLWWRVAFRGDAPRFLRATVGSIGLALAVGLWQLLRPVQPRVKPPSTNDMEAAQRVVEASPYTYAALALLGDKRLLFNDARTAFVMFGTQGRSWIALGDPVGPAEEAPELILRLRELADRFDDWAVFYQVDGENLAWYADLGLTSVKIGEEARVPLAEFSLEGGRRRPLRKTRNRFARLNCTFEMIPADEVASIMSELGAVSDAWLQSKGGREKRFSTGWFHPEYVQRFPIAVLRCERRIVAFANVLCGGGKEELSVDLMRYLPSAPEDAMEELLLELMLWGKSEGYRWFNLGMAPLAGLEDHPLAPTWNRLGAVLFRHGEEFYNFQGLRRFKDQFDPVWRPKYLAARGGLALPFILVDIASLISGGILRIIKG